MNYLFMTYPLRVIFTHFCMFRDRNTDTESDSASELDEKCHGSIEKTDIRIILMPRKWPLRELSVNVDMPFDEIAECYSRACQKAKNEIECRRWDYYQVYLKHLFNRPVSSTALPNILKKLEKLREIVECRISNTLMTDARFVSGLIERNKYISKSTKRPGIIVKLFHTYFEGRDVLVKVYLFDPKCQSMLESIQANFENEATFQLYASQLSSVDFISPELYSFGQLRRILLKDSRYEYRCYFLIMEYMEGIVLKEATYSTENMRHIYERVAKINESLSGHLLHHNDLHSRNVMVRDIPDSPLPEIILVDFGEASLGPTKPLFASY